MPKTQLFLIFVAILALVGLDYLHAAWSAPTGNPPSANIATPLNTGGAAQTKSGALGAGALSITGESQFNGRMIFPFSASGAGKSQWTMIANDGTGNFNIYLNSTGGKSPTFTTGGYANKELYNPNTGIYYFIGSGSSGAAGGAITWQNLLKIFPDGRIGADQYCNISGNNCATSVGSQSSCAASTGLSGGTNCGGNAPDGYHAQIYRSQSSNGYTTYQCNNGTWEAIASLSTCNLGP